MRTEAKKVLRVISKYGGMEAYTGITILKGGSFLGMKLTPENVALFKGLTGKATEDGQIMFTVDSVNIFLSYYYV